MKYIKKFENNTEYSAKDFYNIRYWRYRNSMIDTILCVEDSKFLKKNI